MAPRGLGPGHPPRVVHHLRAQRLDAQPRRGPDGDRRLLRGRRGLRRGRRLPRDRHHRARREATRARCCASSCWSRARRWRTSSRRCARPCGRSCRPATSPTGSSSSTPCHGPSTARSARCPSRRSSPGCRPEKAVSRGALQNPEALGPFLDLAGRPGSGPWSRSPSGRPGWCTLALVPLEARQAPGGFA